MMLKKPEFIVFAAIAILVVVMTAAFNPGQAKDDTGLPVIGKAPELEGISGWLNSGPTSIGGLRGKVVLVDFWTYSCINCIRTLPYLNDWHSKYSDDGLVIIGVHTPEFEFEKDYGNVKAAVEKYGIKYAVAQDNGYSTWRAYGNRYWPRKYLIDRDGNIRYDHIGEGGYKETEEAIQELLGTKETIAQQAQNTDFSKIGTPEIYMGYGFARQPLGNDEGFSPGEIVDYAETNVTKSNIVYLYGKWKNEADRVISAGDSRLYLAYSAKNVNIVAGGPSILKVFLDGKEVKESDSGADTSDGTVTIGGQRLYNIISSASYGNHLVEIAAGPGLELYTFTFG